MINKKRGIGNFRRILILSILVVSLLSFNVFSQIVNGNTNPVAYDFRCDITGDTCGGTCKKAFSIPTDACTLNVILKGANWDDEGGTSTDTGFQWSHTGCKCKCPDDKGGDNCAGEDQKLNLNVKLPDPLGNPIAVSINAINSCKGPLGIIIAHYVVTQAQCNDGYKCDSSTGTVQCVKDSSSTKEKTTCYGKDGNKQDPQSLTPDNFGVFVTDAGVEQADGDASSGACNCIKNSVWDATAKCCGDDTSDGGKIVSDKFLCNVKSDGPNEWLLATTAGNVRYVSSEHAEYLSTGSAWKKCDGQFWNQPVGDREYICVGRGKGSIIQCRGDATSISQADGGVFSTGQSIKPSDFKSEPIISGSGASVPASSNTNTYYCASNKKFVNDLDSVNYQSTCEKAGFAWTGTKCCSEDDDNTTICQPYSGGCPETQGCIPQEGEGCSKVTEYYNDEGAIGGCWDSSLIKPGVFVKGTDYSVINFNGVFHGCNIKDSLKQIKDKQASDLIKNHAFCSNEPVKGYYCSYFGTWNLTNGKNNTHLTFIPSTGTGAFFRSDGTPYFTFYPNDGTLVANRDAFTFTLNDAQPGTKLMADIKKDLQPIGSRLTICEVGIGSTSCTSSAVPQVSDLGKYTEDIFINAEKKGTINVEVVANNNADLFKSGDVLPYFTFTPNNGVMPAGRGPFTFKLYGSANDKLSVNINKNEQDIGSVSVCQIPSGSSSCTFTASPRESDAGFYKEDVLINDIKAGSISLLVTSSAAECCAKEQCWDGNRCVDNQKSDVTSAPIYSARCIDGVWVPSKIKYIPDGSKSGYCGKESQCLLSVEQVATEKCIDSGTYRQDNYCEDGNWTSRTKLLALKFLKIKNELGNSDFKLFCDNKTNTLNYLEYTIGDLPVSAILESDLGTNNFCVLITQGKIVLGSTTNHELKNVRDKGVLGIGNCDNTQALVADGEYHFCDPSSKKLWFNQKLNSFIFSNSGVEIKSQTEQASLIRSLIKNIIDKIKRIIGAVQPEQVLDDTFIKGITKFDRLYLSKESGKIVRGSIDGLATSNINAVFEYQGLNFDICQFVRKYNQTKKMDSRDDKSGMACNKDSDIYYVLAQGNKFTLVNPDTIWTDMTSKLRLK